MKKQTKPSDVKEPLGDYPLSEHFRYDTWQKMKTKILSFLNSKKGEGQ